MEIVKIPIKSLKPYKKNAKLHPPEQITALIKSMEAYKVNTVIGVWGPDNEIVYGHGRVEAFKKMGLKEAPCIRLDHLTEEQAKAFRLVDNQTGIETGYDIDLLNSELDNLLNFNMGDFGLNKKLPKLEEQDIVHCPECGLEFDALQKKEAKDG